MTDLISPETQLFDRLSFNQKTVNRWSMQEALNGCARAGIPYIGLWRDKVAELGVATTAKCLRELDLKVSSLCRGGFFPAHTRRAFEANLDDNRRAIEEAASLAPTCWCWCVGLPWTVTLKGPGP